MSYILDALKKSDQDRQRQGVPGLLTVHDSGAHSHGRRASWPWLVLLLVNGAAAAALLLYLHRGEKEAAVRPAAGQVEQQIPAGPAATPAVLPARVPEAVRDGVSQPPARLAPATPPPSLAAEGRPAVAQRRPPAIGATRPETLPAQAQPASQTPAAEKVGRGAPDSSLEQPGPEDDAVSEEQQVEEEELLADAPGQVAKFAQPPAPTLPARGAGRVVDPHPEIPYFDKLPASVRSGLPQIAISFHVYAQKQESRVVSINGKLLREGQDVTDGLKLEQIIPEGVILNYMGERFRMKVF